jgi:hypothetical protein
VSGPEIYLFCSIRYGEQCSRNHSGIKAGRLAENSFFHKWAVCLASPPPGLFCYPGIRFSRQDKLLLLLRQACKKAREAPRSVMLAYEMDYP